MYKEEVDSCLPSIEKRDTLTDSDGKGLPPLCGEERHSLICTEKESASSLNKKKRETLSSMRSEGVCLHSRQKRDTLWSQPSFNSEEADSFYMKKRVSILDIESNKTPSS